MKTFRIYGKICFDVDIDIEAKNEHEALKEALKEVESYYHLFDKKYTKAVSIEEYEDEN